MNRSEEFPKRSYYRCDVCYLCFTRYGSLEAHQKTDCSKRRKFSSVPGESITEEGSTKMQDEPVSDRAILSAASVLLDAAKIKKSAFEAFVEACERVKHLWISYNSEMQRKEKALLTGAAMREQMISSDKPAQMISEVEEILNPEENVTTALEVRQALDRLETANLATASATSRAQCALIVAEKAMMEERNENVESQGARAEVISPVADVLKQTKVLLVLYEKYESQHRASVDVTVEAISKMMQGDVNEHGNFSIQQGNGTDSA